MDKVLDRNIIKEFKKPAEQGDASAQFWLALYYESGEDYSKAVEWYTKAAEQGAVDAQFHLAICYENGEGVEQNYTKAVEWYTKAAEQGDVDAQFHLAICYENGEGVEQNYIKAVEWYTKAAEQGNADAQKSLSSCYKRGIGVKKNNTKAIEWLTKAAEQGDASAQNNLAFYYAYGDGVKKNNVKAIEWLTKAAEQGDVDAQFNLAVWYMRGIVVKTDYSKAIEWYTKAAEQGDPIAQYEISVCYEKKDEVKKNNVKATEWLTKSAEQLLKKYKKADKMHTHELLFGITEIKQDTLDIRSEIGKIKASIEGIDKKIDHLIDFVKNSLPNEIKKEREILSSELQKINSSIEQNDAAVAEWNRKMDEYICKNIQKCGETGEIANAEQELCNSFGPVWDKLSSDVRTSLVSSKVMWLKCRGYDSTFDFSGVCITATAALENLITKVFLKDFQEYLQNNNIPLVEWPGTLVYNDHGTLKPNKFFTLGNLKYLLGGDNKEWNNRTNWTECQKMNLENYLKSIIKKDTNYNSHRDILLYKKYHKKSFLGRCEDIRIKYRNEAAHSNCVDWETARGCHSEIVAREHLESINNIILILFDLLKEEN